MILSTTNSIEGRKAVKYLGLVSGDVILDIDYETIGANASGTAVVIE